MPMRNRFALFLLLLSTLKFVPPSKAQLVQIGPTDLKHCENVEHLAPNLRVSGVANVSGSLFDDSGAPFKTSRIELRVYLSPTQQTFVKTVATDGHGQFDLGKVEAGQYRLIASATRAFAQPEALTCTSKECKFDIKLHVNPTDLPTSVCPVR